jgi:hypothetical protein
VTTQPPRGSRRRTALPRLAAAIASAFACDGLAQTQSSWVSALGGSFTDASKWSTTPFYPTAGNPVGVTYDAVIAAGGTTDYTVTLSSPVTLNSLTLGGRATLAFDGGTLSVAGSFRPGANPVTGTGIVRFVAGPTQPTHITIAPAPGVPVATLGPGITLDTAGLTGTLGSPTQSVHVLSPVLIPIHTTLFVDGPDWSLPDVTVSGTLRLLNTFPTSRLAGIRHDRGNGLIIINGTLDNTGATLDLAQAGGNVTWTNTIKGGTITSSSPSATLVPIHEGTVPLLDGVTIDFDWAPRNIPLFRFANGLALANDHVLTVNSGTNAGAALTGTGSVTGSGSIVFNNNANLHATSSMKADALGPGITVRTAAAFPAALSSVSLDVPSLQGTVVADVPRFSVTLAGANWVNTGTLVVNRGTLLLGGSFTPSSIGRLVRTGDGGVYVNGTLNMPPGDDTLNIDDSTGSLGFSGGTVNGGTIRTAGGAVALVSGSPTFQNVTLAGTLNVGVTSTVNTGASPAGLILDNATITLANATKLIGPLSGTGHVNFAGAGLLHPNTPSFTYGPNLSFSALKSTATLGTVGQSITTRGALSVSAPGTLVLAATNFTNAGTITAAEGAILGLNPSTFVNQGTLDIAAGAIIQLLGPTSTAAYRAMGLPTTPLYLSGSLDNTGETLTSTPAAPVTAFGATITGGTLAGSPDAPFTLSSPTLKSTTLVGAIALQGTLSASSNFTLAPGASLTLVSYSNLPLSSATLAGTADVTFSGTDPSNTVSGAITVPAGLTIRTGTQGGTVTSAGSLTANGLVSAETPGKVITVAGTSVRNNGTLRATNAAFLHLLGPTTNTGLITAGPGSSVKVSGTLVNAGRVDLAGGSLVLDYGGFDSPVGNARAQLLAGRNGGTWDGTAGFTSSAGGADPHHALAIGYAEATQLFKLSGSQTATFAGQPVDSTSLLFKLTRYGDANMDGAVDAGDYALLDRSLAKGVLNARWTDGDFDYDGVIGASDYLLIDRTSALQGGGHLSPALLAHRESQFGPGYVSELVASVPEPSVLLVGAGLMVIARRQRRARR